MRIEPGEILKSNIKKNRDAAKATQVFQMELSEEGDAQDIEELHIPGVQYNPAAKSRGFVVRVANAWKMLIGIDDFIPKETLAPGERLFYSDDGTVIKARIRLNVDGTITIGDGTEELMDLFDQMLTELQKSVDLGGTASTGALFKINPALAIIQTKLGTIKG